MDHSLSVLLVEDDPDLSGPLAEALEAEGIDVRVARNGHEALALAGRHNPRVILCDLMMPEMSGLDFLRAYRTLPPPRAPVVIMSGAHAYLPSAREHGAAAVLAKPFELEALLRVLRLCDSSAPTDNEAIA